jgi:hypothetical protein
MSEPGVLVAWLIVQRGRMVELVAALQRTSTRTVAQTSITLLKNS